MSDIISDRYFHSMIFCFSVPQKRVSADTSLTDRQLFAWSLDVDALRYATPPTSRLPNLPPQKHTLVHTHMLTHYNISREHLSCSVLFHVFILGLLMRHVLGILSGPSDLSVDVQPSSPFDPQENDWNAVVLPQHSLWVVQSSCEANLCFTVSQVTS